MTNKYKIIHLNLFKKLWSTNFGQVRLKLIIVLLFSLSQLIWPLTSLSAYTEPTSKTNINEIDQLFNEKIDDYKGFEQILQGQKASAVKGVESELGFNDLVGSDEARAKGSKLSNIRAEELKGAGIRKSIKKGWVNEYLIDYSRPGMVQRKEDAEKISQATGKMLEGLIGLLKKLDIDCKQVKGNKEYDPQYYIQLTKELDRDKGDTIYDQIICEELRNKYHCTDTVTVKCSQKTSRELKPTTIALTHHEMPGHWWIGRGRGGRRCYNAIENTTDNFAIFNNCPEILAEVKQKIIERTANTGNSDIVVPDQEIMFFQGEDGVSLSGINSSGRVVLYQLDPAGNKGYVQNTWHPNPEAVSGTVRFFYKVVQEEQCLQWDEEWNEVCRLQ